METVSQEKAEKIVSDLCEIFGTQLEDDSRGTILRGITSGRLTFDEAKEEFTVRLIQPIEQENKEQVSVLKIVEPTVDQMKTSNNLKDDFTMTLSVLSAVTGQPLGIINRLKMRDISLAGSVLAFFV